MKVSLIIHFSFLMLSISSLASAMNGRGRVVFYRSDDSSATNYEIFENRIFITAIKKRSYFVYHCKEGVHAFNINMREDLVEELWVDANNVHYVRVEVERQGSKFVSKLVLSDSSEAARLLNPRKYRKILTGGKYTVVEHTQKKNPSYSIFTDSIRSRISIDKIAALMPKNRIGMYFTAALGSENVALGTSMDTATNEIDTVRTSFGGGYGFRLEYGRVLFRHIDLALAWQIQANNETPSLYDADFKVRMSHWSISPSIILPFRHPGFRWLLGGGIDYYSRPHFKINVNSTLDKLNTVITYQECVGYHTGTSIQIIGSKMVSVIFGVRYYQTDFHFKSATNNLHPAPSIATPNGNGVQFSFGYAKHF
jgi:hypothetical protein